MPQNELTVLYNINKQTNKQTNTNIQNKKPEGRFVRKIQRNNFLNFVIYTYNQQLKGNNSARQTRTQHLNTNIPTTHTESKVKQYSLTLSTNKQIMQYTNNIVHILSRICHLTS